MSLDPFLQSLGFEEPADLDTVERRFIEVVKDHIQKASLHYDEGEVANDEKLLRNHYSQYFLYVTQQMQAEMQAQKNVVSAEAQKLKKQAAAQREELQDHMIDFACCYMHINRFMTLLRDEIRNEEARLGGGSITGTKWTADAGTLITRNKQKKKYILEANERFSAARLILDELAPSFDTLRHHLIKLHGSEKAETSNRSFIASLRTQDFKKARKLVEDISRPQKKFGLDQKASDQSIESVMVSARYIIEVCEKNSKTLSSHEGRLYLKPIETDQAYNAQIRELRKIKEFLSKYYMPYMQYKLDMLMHLKDKLLVNGSIENLMTLYRRMVAGMTGSLDDIKSLRAYESEVLDKIKYLLGGQFQEVPVILARAKETVQEFRAGAEEFRDVENIDVTEIDITSGDEERMTTGSYS